MASALVMAIALGMVAAQTVNVDPAGTSRGEVSILPAPAVANAAELGALAAEAAAAQPIPRPTQWVYLRMLSVSSGRGPQQPVRRLAEAWLRADNRQVAVRWDGKLQFMDVASADTGGPLPPNVARDLLGSVRSGVPSDPDSVLAWAYRKADDDLSKYKSLRSTREEEAFIVLVSTVQAKPLLPPKVQAAIYRALSRIPGVGLSTDAVDAAGRRGIALALAGQEIIFDPRTYHYLGSRVATTTEGEADGGFVSSARLAMAIVDRAGQRR